MNLATMCRQWPACSASHPHQCTGAHWWRVGGAREPLESQCTLTLTPYLGANFCTRMGPGYILVQPLAQCMGCTDHRAQYKSSELCCPGTTSAGQIAISVPERPQTRDSHWNRHPEMPISAPAAPKIGTLRVPVGAADHNSPKIFQSKFP